MIKNTVDEAGKRRILLIAWARCPDKVFQSYGAENNKPLPRRVSREGFEFGLTTTTPPRTLLLWQTQT